MSNKKDYYILTDSKEEFEELEKAYNQLKESYDFLLKGPIGAGDNKMILGRIIIKDSSNLVKSELKNKNLKRWVQIYPNERSNVIEKIITKDSKLEKNIKEVSPLGWVMRTKDYAFGINRKNPYFHNINSI